MSEEPTTRDILERHLELLAEVHALFLEESAILRSTGGLPDEAFLQRKQGFISRLDQSLAGLRTIGGAAARLDPDSTVRVKEARKRMLQLLMLDRENERMLLKVTVSSSLRQQYAPLLPGRVAKAYGQAAEDKKAP
jgi:hypothetical protein